MQSLDSIRRWSALTLVLAAALTACGGPLRYTPKGTPRAPEADATITADVNKGSSLTRLAIRAEHLAPPGRLQDGGTTYVVWARKADGSQWQRVGAIAYDEATRIGSLLDASVPLTEFELIVSIEKQPAPDAPSGDVVLSQKCGG